MTNINNIEQQEKDSMYNIEIEKEKEEGKKKEGKKKERRRERHPCGRGNEEGGECLSLHSSHSIIQIILWEGILFDV